MPYDLRCLGSQLVTTVRGSCDVGRGQEDGDEDIARWSDCGPAECGAHCADGSSGQNPRVHFAVGGHSFGHQSSNDGPDSYGDSGWLSHGVQARGDAVICELEGKPAVERLKVQSFQSEEMMEWFERLTKEHPAFQGIPERLRKELVVPPEVNAVAGNRRFRKLWRKQKGVILHLYSGENDGFTFRRAVKDLGGDVRKVIEVDLKNGEQMRAVEHGGGALVW